MRIAIDTTCLIAALTSPRGSCAELVRVWRDSGLEVVASPATLAEARGVLGGRWLARMVGSSEVQALLADIRARSEWIESPPAIHDLPLKDVGDVRMVEAAVGGGARLIATTDREFLSHRGYDGCEFVTPEEALGRLHAEHADPHETPDEG